ncbi:MAG TPA: deoxyribodipyrimidine photo-lyase [Gammaproteobacteria bacterium]|nr:deoxyribodipyrimidine photo-lyase [Gammaproteobacteria bacterium]
MTAIVLFRRDLRLADNAALTAACLEHDQVMALYVHEPGPARWGTGAASRWWLHHSLAALQAALASRGGALNILQGDASQVLPELCRRHGVRAVYWNRRYEPVELADDSRLALILKAL